jgi:hypothetical protein
MLGFACSQCHTRLRVPEQLLGRKIKCPHCGAILNLPTTASRPANASGPPPEACNIRAGTPAVTQTAPPPPPPVEATTDDEGVEERTRRPLKEKKKSPAARPALPPWLIALGSGLAVVVVGTVLLLAIFLWRRQASNLVETPPEHFLPDTPLYLVSLHMQDMLQSGAWQELQQELPELQQVFRQALVQESSLSPMDMTLLLAGGNAKGEKTLILELAKPYSVEQLQKAFDPRQRWQAERVGSFTLYVDAQQSAFLSSGQRVVVGPASVLRSVLERRGPPQLSEAFRAAWSSADKTKTLVLIAAENALNTKNLLPGGGALPFKGPAAGKSEPKALSLEVDAGADVGLRLVLHCQDAAEAQAAKREFELSKLQLGLLAFFFPKEIINIFTNMNTAVQGNQLVMSTRFAMRPVARSLKQWLSKQKLPGGNPFLPPGNNPGAPPGFRFPGAPPGVPAVPGAPQPPAGPAPGAHQPAGKRFPGP